MDLVADMVLFAVDLLALLLVQWKLPPLPALAGLVAGYAVNVFAFRFKG